MTTSEDKLVKTEHAIVRWRRRLRRALNELDKLEKRKVRYEKTVRASSDAEPAGSPAPQRTSIPANPPEAPPAAPQVETKQARKSKEQMRPRGYARLAHLAKDLPAAAREAAEDQGLVRAKRMQAMGFRKTGKKK